MKPIVVLPVARPDFHLAVKLLRWCARLRTRATPVDDYQLIVYGTKALEPSQWSLLHDAASGLNATLLSPPELFEQGYAPSANYTFRTALELCEREFPQQPILWAEADTVPMRPTWATEIAAEYEACGKPFLGDLIRHRPGTPGAIDHMTGNAVYPPNWRELAPSIAMLPEPRPEQGFDSACAHEIVPQAARAVTIQQIWRPPFITDQWAARFIHPSTALFHQCKDASLIDVLTARAGEKPIPLGVPLCPSTYPAHVASLNTPKAAPPPPRTSLMIVTYAKDMEFLRYSLASIKLYARGFAETVVAVPEKERGLYNWIGRGVRVEVFDEPPGKGMMAAQIQKCRADEWCPNAEFIVHLDADCLFFRPTTPADLVPGGRALMVREAYSAITNPNRHIWKRCVEKALGWEPAYDTMVRHPQVHPAAVYGATRAAVEKFTRQKFNDYVLSCKNDFPQGWCEWVTIGAVGLRDFEGAYSPVDYDHAADAALARQAPGSFQYLYKRDRDHIAEFWSHGGIARYKSDCEAVLAGRVPAYWIK